MDADRGVANPPHPRLYRFVQHAIPWTPVVATLGCALLLHRGTAAESLAALVLGVFYALAFRTGFESSRGGTVPTEPPLVALLMTTPAAWIPLVVMTAVVVGSLPDLRSDTPWREWLPVTTASAWNMMAPVLAVLALGRWAPGLPQAAVITIAVALQLASDALHVLASAYAAGELDEVVRPLRWMLAVDALLAVVGYCIVATTGAALPGLLLVGAPILLLRLLANDRVEVFGEAEHLRSAKSEAEEEARRDPMTGLLNRRGWEDALADTTLTLAGSGEVGAAVVLAADLDRLKHTNDTFGHAAGDALICGFADLLETVTPRDAAVARLGGDEFAVLVTARRVEDLPDLLTQVRDAVAAAPANARYVISASLGVALYPPAPSLEAAVDAADHAARVDKEMRRMGRDQVAASH